ncbi:DUF3299 domain-containing protein [Methylophaga sp. OBS4]|uniref:DUF3299 domain-containing protein n=1 Tax=Methylophaga sp. OBS4 TaxID=2991935 RepID=UPI0022553576|nr:DUF3299 domain-containing protein [Methylophaga sp. OBS4]MCX4186970.1 DUF3299 domain-containing protein [Methylophaga sp. OBS4]
MLTIFPLLVMAESTKSSYQQIEWTDLLPEADLQALLNPPEALNNIEDGSEADQISNALSDALSQAGDSRYQQALISTRVRDEYDNQLVRLPGFIVPIEINAGQIVTRFFLVPYFGACIHVPPPPPNQIVYASFEQGMKIDSIYDPYWLEGTLHTTVTENEMATSAYSMSVTNVIPYQE